ncbi:MAG TPA: cupin domain-containing protein [Dehalococcoidia bacterium]|nr:cupin domain-containing protein [Dehalococcoidia bacterium]
MSESSGHTYTQTHQISGESLHLDVETEAKAILEAAAAAGVGHAAKTLVKEGPLRVVILGMKQGARLREHRAEGPASIHVLSGEVTVTNGGGETHVRSGNALVFGADIAHSLEAKQDSAILLTIAWPQGQRTENR